MGIAYPPILLVDTEGYNFPSILFLKAIVVCGNYLEIMDYCEISILMG